MANVRFLYENLVDKSGVTLTESSEVSSLPVENITHQFRTLVWRTSGYYLITAASNDKLDFDEGGGELTATITAATYTATTLAAEIQTQLDAAGGDNYTVSYSTSTYKFTIASDGAALTIKWNTGTNTATTVGDTIGFDTSADDSGATSYTADDIACHSEEWTEIDLGQAYEVTSFAMINHNLSSTATIKIQGHSSAAWAAPSVDETVTYNSDICTKHFTGGTYRYWRLYITDTDNADGYIETGRVYIGSYFEPSTNINYGWSYMKIDPSEVNESAGGQEIFNIKSKYRVLRLEFSENNPLTQADRDSFETMFDYVGNHIFFFIALDYTNEPNDYSHYGRSVDPMNMNEFTNSLFSQGINFKEAR